MSNVPVISYYFFYNTIGHELVGLTVHHLKTIESEIYFLNGCLVPRNCFPQRKIGLFVGGIQS